MNIFYTDSDPKIAAQNLCDKHVVKMLLESCQMLSTAYRAWAKPGFLIPPAVYKSAYIAHPCTEWVAENSNHFEWLKFHAWAIEAEYQHRYRKYHACRAALFEFSGMRIATHNIPGREHDWRDPPQCMPVQYKDPDTIHAYRSYYAGEKMKFAVWTRRDPPAWLRSSQYSGAAVSAVSSNTKLPITLDQL